MKNGGKHRPLLLFHSMESFLPLPHIDVYINTESKPLNFCHYSAVIYLNE